MHGNFQDALCFCIFIFSTGLSIIFPLLFFGCSWITREKYKSAVGLFTLRSPRPIRYFPCCNAYKIMDTSLSCSLGTTLLYSALLWWVMSWACVLVELFLILEKEHKPPRKYHGVPADRIVAPRRARDIVAKKGKGKKTFLHILSYIFLVSHFFLPPRLREFSPVYKNPQNMTR